MAYESTTELRTLLQEEVNDTSPSATTQTRYLNLLDRAHKAIISGGGELNLDDTGNPIRRPFIFPWALSQSPKIETIIPKVEDTSSVTNNSPTVTVSVNSATTDLTGYHVRFLSNREIVYRVLTHAGTTVTLDGNYIRETAAAEGTEFYKLIYSFGSDVFLPTDQIRIYSKNGRVRSISMVDSAELFDKAPIGSVFERTPRMAAVLRQTNGTIVLQFDSYPVEAERIEFWYIPTPADLDLVGSNPILPAHHRTLLAYLAAFYHLRKRDDDRSASHFRTAKQMWDALTTEARQIVGGNDANFGFIAPWPGGFEDRFGFPGGSIIVDVP